ncbi:MAG TPA: proline--tRNA ligase [Chthoniobacteraceae bacterium]|nr:proline--tRNA ligase [Chthoniobacteraceae bacterium]
MSQQQKPQPQQPQSAITPIRADDFPEWYQQVVKAAELAEASDVRGCMVIKPWGYGLWEEMQRGLDGMFKATGHKNAYFPLFIPLSYLAKEAEHVEGFAKECAVVTHHRLESDGAGGLRPAPSAALTEPLIVRPTSETIIGATYAKWVQSYRDLPILINQWANVVRWELRPRLFLRTAEFLWQEGHTAHETEAEAREETMKMLRVYETFARDWLALPVFTGEKSAGERFPGAVQTLCIEAMVQDRKAIQAGTSHFLGQNFAKASGIQFLTRENKQEFAWTTSWGVSTRLIGTLIMAHSDDDGAILPPRVAPAHIVISPVAPKPETRDAVYTAVDKLAADLRAQSFHGAPLRVEVDKRDIGGGQKNWEWIKKGVPIRVELGPRDLEKGSVAVARRDKGVKEKEFPAIADFVAQAPAILQSIQDGLLARATQLRDAHTVKIDTRDEFYAFFTPKNTDKPEIHGGFALSPWCGSAECEEKIKADLKVTIRCIPFDAPEEAGSCICGCGRASSKRVVFAKSY